MNSKNKNNLSDLTVIIPSVGRSKELNKTVLTINNGKNKPKSIIIVIPKAEIINLDIIYQKNLSFYATNDYGQVKQRVIGFNLSKTKFTMQLDDDCLISQESILKLKKNIIKLGKKNCVGPIFLSKKNEPLHKFNNKILINILSLIFNIPIGLNKMGKTNYTNLNFGIDPNYTKKNLNQVQWIPGGCKLMYTNDLIKYNYFHFMGKAYYEDIIHSKILKEKDIKMWIIKNSICKTDTVNFSYNEISFIRNIVKSNFQKSILKYWLWLMLVVLKKSI